MKHIFKSINTHSLVFLTAGYPDKEQFFTYMKDAESCGMGIFEIGFPTDDPYADGEIIRKSYEVVDHGIREDMDFWKMTQKYGGESYLDYGL